MELFDGIGAFVLALGLATIMVLVLLMKQNRAKKDVTIWLASGAIGILLGAAASAAIVRGMGYEVVVKAQPIPVEATGTPATTGAAPAMGMPGGGGGGMGSGMGGGGGGMGGMMGMMGGGMGGQPQPKRQLTTLVRKLELLTGDIAIALTPEQTKAVQTALDELSAVEKMTDDEAKARYEKLLALLDEKQQAKQEAIGLPFRRGGGGGMGGGMGGGAPPDPEANPFADEANANALKSLRARLSGVTPSFEVQGSYLQRTNIILGR